MNKFPNIIIILFLATIYIPFLGLLFLVEYSNDVIEGNQGVFDFRTTAYAGIKIPIVDEKLRLDADKFLASKMIVRESLLDVYSNIKYRVFGVSPTNKVLLGKNGWLFYKGARHLDDYQRTNPMASKELFYWSRIRKWRKRWLNTQGIKYLLVFVPDKRSIYPEYYPDSIKHKNEVSRLDQLINYISSNSRLDYIDLRGPLLEAKKKKKTYFITDSHWNSWGAYIGYREISHALKKWYPNIRILRFSPDSYRISVSNKGDLARMMRQNTYIEESILIPDITSKAFNEHACKEGAAETIKTVWPIINDDDPFLVNCNNKGIKVLAFHDSMFNHLLPYLLYDLGIYYDVRTWPSLEELQWYVNKFKPDIVIEQFTERDVTRLNYKDIPQIEAQLSISRIRHFALFNRLKKFSSTDICSIDRIMKSPYRHNSSIVSVNKETPLSLQGWSAHKKDFSVADELFIEFVPGSSGVSQIAKGMLGVSRLDVANHFKKPALELSGFRAIIEISNLKNDTYKIHLWNRKGDRLYGCDTKLRIKVH